MAHAHSIEHMIQVRSSTVRRNGAETILVMINSRVRHETPMHLCPLPSSLLPSLPAKSSTTGLYRVPCILGWQGLCRGDGHGYCFSGFDTLSWTEDVSTFRPGGAPGLTMMSAPDVVVAWHPAGGCLFWCASLLPSSSCPSPSKRGQGQLKLQGSPGAFLYRSRLVLRCVACVGSPLGPCLEPSVTQPCPFLKVED